MDIHTADLALLKQKNEEIIRRIYEENKEAFLLFVRQYGLPDEEVQDIYQEMMVALYEHAVKGKLEQLKTPLRTYLFAIGKYMVYARLKKAGNIVKLSEFDTAEWSEFAWPYEELVDKRVLALQQSLKQLGEKCRQLLIRYYYHNLTMKVIAAEMEYENADVVKSLKARCMKQLKSILNSSNHG